MRKLNKEQVESLRVLRKAGAPIEDLSRIFGISRVTIWRYTKDVEPAPDGHLLEVVRKATIMEWLPLLPWEGLPLPRWMARTLPVRWADLKEVTEQGDENSNLESAEPRSEENPQAWSGKGANTE